MTLQLRLDFVVKVGQIPTFSFDQIFVLVAGDVFLVLRSVPILVYFICLTKGAVALMASLCHQVQVLTLDDYLFLAILN